MILITGGAGYIGSHTVLTFLESGYEIVVLDDLSNASEESLKRVEKLTNKKIHFIKDSILNKSALDKLLKNYPIEGVIHFAGLKAVGESVEKPLKYYHTNVTGTITLLQALKEAEIDTFVFSSSATVYGDSTEIPYKENTPLGQCTNPYGQSKQTIERILKDLQHAETHWKIASLRYFNPIGAHPSGEIGEAPNGIPNNLLPYVSQVAIGKLKELSVFGDDYPTKDGSGARDYIHVMDLAEAHRIAYEYIRQKNGYHIWNLGTGQAHTVLEIIQQFEKTNHIKIPYQIKPRRAGDLATSYANVDKAKQELNWQAKRDLNTMLADLWKWQKQNPNGYE